MMVPPAPRAEGQGVIGVVADGRSSHTRGWLQMAGQAGLSWQLFSTFPLERHDPPGVVLPLWPWILAQQTRPGGAAGSGRAWLQVRSGSRWRAHYWRSALYPVAIRLARCLRRVSPQAVYSLRLPYESVIADVAVKLAGHTIPHVASVWGNDFTLHAESNSWFRTRVRQVLPRLSGLLADCRADHQRAVEYGFSESGLREVIPGGGGIVDADVALARQDSARVRRGLSLSETCSLVVYPRGYRPGYVPLPPLFSAWQVILGEKPDVVVAAVGLRGVAEAENLHRSIGAPERVRLLPALPRRDVLAMMAAADVVVSPTIHDGTPNSILEAMALGTPIVVGGIPSLREWIVNSWNGICVDAQRPDSIVQGVRDALNLTHAEEEEWAQRNRRLIAERASRRYAVDRFQRFHQDVLVRAGAQAMA